jgi:hypothetical protein
VAAEIDISGSTSRQRRYAFSLTAVVNDIAVTPHLRIAKILLSETMRIIDSITRIDLT